MKTQACSWLCAAAVLAATTFVGRSSAQTPQTQPGASPPDAADADQGFPLNDRLLIIAPNALLESMWEYVLYKKTQMPTVLARLEDVLNQTSGDDDADKVKRFLYIRWRQHQFGYVLLVGDVDVMPVRYMVLDRITPAAFDYAFYASDFYYSDLAKADGTYEDWNAQTEGFHGRYIGEVRGEKNKNDPINFDQIDYHPEVAVGRWPVSTPEEVRVVAAKTMAYEKAMAAGDKPGARTAGLLACGGWVDGRGLLDELATALPKDWTVQKRYYADENRNDHTPPPNAEQAVQMLNAGAELMVHIGHGDNNSWSGSFSVKDLASLNNADRLPIMMSAGCSTAVCTAQAPYEGYVDVEGVEHKGTNAGEVFDAPPPPPACYQKDSHNTTSLGEKLLRDGPNGAVAYIGCNTGGQPCALTLVEGFVTAIGRQEHPRIGSCWLEAVKHYYDKEHLATIKPDDGWYPPSVFYQPMKYMVFGDPSLPIGVGPKQN